MPFEIWLAVLSALVIGGLSVIWVPLNKHGERSLLSAFLVFWGIVEGVFLVTLVGLALIRRSIDQTAVASEMFIGLVCVVMVIPAWEYANHVIARNGRKP